MFELFDKEEPKPIEIKKKSKLEIIGPYIVNFILIVLAIVAGLYLYDYSHLLLK